MLISPQPDQEGDKLFSLYFVEIVGSLPHSQQPTTCPYTNQINPFLRPSLFWQAWLVSFLIGLRTYQHQVFAVHYVHNRASIYRCVDKPLARTGRRQTTFPAIYGTCRFITAPTTANTTCPYPCQFNPFLCPSKCWQLLLVYVVVGLKTYQHRGINFFYTFNASKIFIKFINNLVIRQSIQGKTWDWIKPNISSQLSPGGTNTEHELYLS